ncbi:MAG: asparagine synthase-related protein [Gammaproteobacteria bacterium]
MTTFTGAISLQPNVALPEDLLLALREHVTRSPLDRPEEFTGPGFYLANVDIGAFGARGTLIEDDGSLTVVAGEPLVAEGEGITTWNRAMDLAVMHPLLKKGDWNALRGTRGTFCGVHFNAVTGTASVFVDKTGVRPLYLWVGPHFAVFSTALRVLEALRQVPKEFDVRGVAEISTFTFPLSDRTAYAGIKTLKAGQVVAIGAGQARRELYWRWDGALARDAVDAAAIEHCYGQFIGAIRRRHRNNKVAAAFLSGGLDSRVIVGGLHAAGSDVYTVNYAPDGSQDQVFAELVAKKLGISYTQIQTNADNVAQGYRKSAVAEWLKTTFARSGTRSPLVWSGDGGSVGLGHVYMTRPIVAALQKGDEQTAITLFNDGVAVRIINPARRREIGNLPQQGIREELDELNSPDALRRFHLFLMLNDQRRHLSKHFEDIDVERIEFQLPFFDADFLETILRLPAEPFLYHQFYIDWLARFPNGMNTIAWQAYPGHVPCPVPAPAGLKYQWAEDEYYDKKMYKQIRQATAKMGVNMLTDRAFPAHLLSKPMLMGAIVLTHFGIGNYGYLIKTAATFHQYWKKSQAA